MENYELEQVNYFDDLNLKSDLLRGIYYYGYERPSEIQRKAVRPILQGFDTIAQAQAGAGKSVSFIIPVLQLIDEDLQECQAIILVPTQDLAQQISHLMKCLGEFLKISIFVCDKSVSSDDIEGMQILIGTPEIICKMLKLRSLKISAALKIIAVDEADRLVFQEETRGIWRSLNRDIQVVMVSLTMPDDVLMIAKKHTRSPVIILVKREELILERFRHFYILVDEKEPKSEILVELLEQVGTTRIIIYCNQKETVDEVAKFLSEKSLACSKIDETMEFPDREMSMKKFRTGESRILVTTDLFSKRADIQQITNVLNYDLPVAKEEYLNRLGRCNRLNRGYVISFVMQSEVPRLKEFEKSYGIVFDCYTDYFF